MPRSNSARGRQSAAQLKTRRVRVVLRLGWRTCCAVGRKFPLTLFASTPATPGVCSLTHRAPCEERCTRTRRCETWENCCPQNFGMCGWFCLPRQLIIMSLARRPKAEREDATKKQCPGWDSNPQQAGFEPTASASWATRASFRMHRMCTR